MDTINHAKLPLASQDVPVVEIASIWPQAALSSEMGYQTSCGALMANKQGNEMAVTHYLITDTTAGELERKTGLHGCDTALGVLVGKPKPFDMYRAMAIINRVLEPPSLCICGSSAIIHQPNCPAAWAIT